MANEIQQFFRDHGISEVEAIIPDMAGIARGKIMPAEKFAEDEGMRLPESIFLQTVTGDYPPDTSDAMSPAEIDIVLKADPKTVRRVPWAAEPTAQVIHDCFYSDGRRVTMAPRHVLRNVLELYAQRGWEPVVAPELEFYLVEPNIDADYPLKPPVGRSGRAEPGRQSYSIAAVNEFDPLFDDIYQFCEDQDIEIDTLIHEDGPAQMEINLIHGHPLDLADQAFLFKRTAREAALRHKMYATFMAKPHAKEPGSAMHIHQSTWTENARQRVRNRWHPRAVLRIWVQKYLPAAMALSRQCDSYCASRASSWRRSTCSGATTTARQACACRCRTRRTGAWKTASVAPMPPRTWRSPRRWPAVTWAWSRTCSRRSRSPAEHTTCPLHCRALWMPRCAACRRANR
jgi:glutamine synthetase